MFFLRTIVAITARKTLKYILFLLFLPSIPTVVQGQIERKSRIIGGHISIVRLDEFQKEEEDLNYTSNYWRFELIPEIRYAIIENLTVGVNPIITAELGKSKYQNNYSRIYLGLGGNINKYFGDEVVLPYVSLASHIATGAVGLVYTDNPGDFTGKSYEYKIAPSVGILYRLNPVIGIDFNLSYAYIYAYKQRKDIVETTQYNKVMFSVGLIAIMNEELWKR